MALIGRLNKVTKDRQNVHSEVEAAVSVLTGSDGRRYIQIDTFGSRERSAAGQVSQSMQFDQRAAAELLALIRETYPDLN